MKAKLLLFFTLALSALTGSSQDLDWNTYPDGSYNHTYPNIGNAPVNVGVQVSGSTTSFNTNEPNGRPTGLRLAADFPASGNCVSVVITFSQPVNNLNFNMFDIDSTDGDSQYEDVVTITGNNGGTGVTPGIGSAVTNTVSGNVITGTNSNTALATNLITFSGPVTSVTIQYCAGPSFALPEGQEVYVGDFTWDDAALPVRLMSFSGKQVENRVLLGWQTTFESNSDYFVVERSADAKSFEALGRVASRGFSDSFQSYGFTDEAPLKGTNYYRLRQVDRDGKFENSKILGLTYSSDAFYFEVAVLDRGQIEVKTNAPDPDFAVVNLQGIANLNRVEKVNATRYLLQVNATGLATPALNVVQMRTNHFGYAKRVLLR